MASDRVLVKISSERDSEDAHFRAQDEKRIKELREKAAKETLKVYAQVYLETRK